MLVKYDQFHVSNSSQRTLEQAGGMGQGTKKVLGFTEHLAAGVLAAAALDASVGSKIRARREALNMTQRQLGRELGVTFGQIQKYERGSNRIGAGRLYLAATVLRVPVTHFFEEAGEGLPADAAPAAPTMTGGEFDALSDAFLSVDPDARDAVLSLVRSLAESSAAKRQPNRSA